MAQPKKTPTPQSPRTTVVWTILLVIIFTLLGMQMVGGGQVGQQQKHDTLSTSDFTTAVNEGRVTSVDYDVSNQTISGKYYPAKTAGSSAMDAFNTAFSALNTATGGEALNTQNLDEQNLGEERDFSTTWAGQDTLSELMSSHPNVRYNVQLPSTSLTLLASWLPMILMIGFFIFMFYEMNKANNQQMGFGHTRSKIANEERPNVHFSDVAGCDEAVEEMKEIKDFLANPKKYQELGAEIPRGCLLVGPPGTGKTLLARAVAGEAGVPFFSISGSDFVEMFVGVGASRVRDLFKQAKAAAPAIIFIDEIDAVGRQRGAGLGGGHDEREQTLNQLLVEMDGFSKNDSVVLLAATNRADVLDPALLRPGRFDRQIVVDVPDVRGREKILQVHARNKPIAQDVDLEEVAKMTPGFTGADLENLLNESALLTARRGKKVISMDAVVASMERVIAGPERKGRVLNQETKRTIAYHESGHALVGHLLPHADPVHKISIVSRGRALGYTLSIPDEDRVMNSKNEMLDQLAVFLGGRVSEELFCDDITTGASNDLERATKLARSMITQYGMSSELGTQIFGEPNHEVFLGRDYGNTKGYSEETAKRIDDEVSRLMKQAHDRAKKILSEHSDQIALMASVLLDRETVDGAACQALLDNKWSEYLAHEQSEEGKAECERAATTLANPNQNENAQAGDVQSTQQGQQQTQQPGVPQYAQHAAPSAPTAPTQQPPVPPQQSGDGAGQNGDGSQQH